LRLFRRIGEGFIAGFIAYQAHLARS
jgi:hypothetical protein